jgi:hypothetical protein
LASDGDAAAMFIWSAQLCRLWFAALRAWKTESGIPTSVATHAFATGVGVEIMLLQAAIPLGYFKQNGYSKQLTQKWIQQTISAVVVQTVGA